MRARGTCEVIFGHGERAGAAEEGWEGLDLTYVVVTKVSMTIPI